MAFTIKVSEQLLTANIRGINTEHKTNEKRQ